MDLSHMSHISASTKERKKYKTGPSLQESFLGEKKSVWGNVEYFDLPAHLTLSIFLEQILLPHRSKCKFTLQKLVHSPYFPH